MKKGMITMFAFASLFIVACGGGEKEEVVVEEAAPEAVVYMADANSSKVNWRGEVAGVYGHEGYVNLKNGTLEIAGDQLVGGKFEVDMTNIYPTDSSYEFNENSNPEKLAGHLATEDFFATATYPTSTFVITSVEGNTVKGNLTVRDKTNEETFTITSMEMTDNGVNMTGTLVFDRQKYDVAWVHFMKDMILSDDIALKVNLVATK